MTNTTWIEINLKKIKENFQAIKKLVNEKTKILPVIKSNAYGHGLLKTARALDECGASYFGIGRLSEAQVLRRAKLAQPLILLNPVLEKDLDYLVELDITPMVSSLEEIERINRIGLKHNKKIKIHLKVDTGMGRLGAWPDELTGLAGQLKGMEGIELEGLCTHFPSAESDDDFTRGQVKKFNNILKDLAALDIKPPLQHLANSPGIMELKESHFNMVRPGLALYQDALSLKTRVLFLKKFPIGKTISYGRTFKTTRDSLIAILPVGYSDGYHRALSNKASVLINGERFPIVGTISMNHVIVDITDARKKIALGDCCTLLGADNGNIITANELAELSNTIPYEILTSLNKEIPRIYKS